MQFNDITNAVLAINPDAKVVIRKSNDLDNFEIEYLEIGRASCRERV